ncbi:MAG: hypothetical protein AAFU71_20300, partial [Cyanobacteria bacterium J06632_22]
MEKASDWSIAYRFLVDDYPLTVLHRASQWRFESIGRSKKIIEQLLPLSDPVTDVLQEQSSPSSIQNHQLRQRLHSMFLQGDGLAEGPLFYAVVDPVLEYDSYKLDAHFLQTLEQYQQKTGRPLAEPLWHVNHNFAG